jgi:hypothetical protein
MKRMNNKGFSAVEFILLLVIAGILAGISVYILQAKSNTFNSYSNSSNSFGSPPKSKPPTGTVNKSITSGITGYSTAGPYCAAVRADNASSCTKTYEKSYKIVIKDTKTEKIISTIQTDDKGKFSQALAPGTYSLEPENPVDSPMHAKPSVTSVSANKYSIVIINFDTGIR